MALDRPAVSRAVDAGQRRVIAHRGRLLQFATIALDCAECVVALVAGFLAGSIALVGFGFDSAIEVTSSVAALWRLRRDADEVGRAGAEQRTMRIIGGCFLVLAVYVCYEAVRALVDRKSRDDSTVGIVLAILSLLVMPALAHFKRRSASMLASGALEAEARQTEVCAWLSAVLLTGLGLTRGSAGDGRTPPSSHGRAGRRCAAERAARTRYRGLSRAQA
jgi:divalent metal cation (Fe/Co/Zn/Cd) transporter